jgi:AcrR family transcriptional regulator
MAGFDTRTEGRKSAYVARNRTAIIKAAQEVLASDGSDATVESVAVLAEMSVSTIYKHFPKREDLFHTALLSGINEWESWAKGVVSEVTDPIERLLFPMRLQVKLPETHPTFAKMVAADVALFVAAAPGALPGFSENIVKLQRAKLIKSVDTKARIQNISMVMTMVILGRCSSPPLPEKEALHLISIALEMIGLTKDQIKHAWTAPLPDFSVR